MTKDQIGITPMETPSGEGVSLWKEQVSVAVLMTVVLSFGFYFTDSYMATQAGLGRKFWIPATVWDSRIPLSSGWVWVYFLYFPVCFTPLLFEQVRSDLAVFRRTALGFVLQFVVGFIFFWCLPSRMLSPKLDAATLSAQALHWFYRIDPGFNIFPSLHLANSAYVACLVSRMAGWRWGALLWLVCLAIAASTLLVKQHYLVDLPAGCLLGILSYRLAFWKCPHIRSADASSACFFEN